MKVRGAEPLVLQDRLEVASLLRILARHADQQCQHLVGILLRLLLGDDHRLVQNLGGCQGSRLFVEGEEAEKEDEADDSKAPHVDFIAIREALEDFGGCVGDSANALLHSLIGKENARETKVCDLSYNFPTLVLCHDILDFEVPVNNAVFVEVSETMSNLVDKILAELQVELEFVLLAVVEQVASLDELHHQIDSLVVLIALVKPHNVGVVRHLHYFDLGALHDDLAVGELALLDHLYGNLLVGDVVPAFVDQTELPLSNFA